MTDKLMMAILCAGTLMLTTAGPSMAQEDEKAAFEKTLAEAKAAQKQAATVGGEWRDVGNMLKDAAKAAESGDYKAATKLAQTAKSQSELGYEQSLQQKSAKMEDYIK